VPVADKSEKKKTPINAGFAIEKLRLSAWEHGFNLQLSD
jgi:hypothetical protein